MRIPKLLLAALALGPSPVWGAAPSGAFSSGAPCRPALVRELDAIPVFDAFGTAPGAWRGGWRKARPQLIDFDGDGDVDLFVTEETGQLRYYRNDGTPSAPDFRYVTDDFAGVHEFYFTRMVDVDTDGDWDLLVQAPDFTFIGDGGVMRTAPGGFLYTNTGTPLAPVWENRSVHPDGYFVDENGDPIAFSTTSPDFTDLEDDGDPDLLMGDASGSLILYRNVGTPSSPSFRFETSTYQNIVIVFGSCNPTLTGPVTLGEMLGNSVPGLRHGFMLFSFHDLNADGRPDLFVGDQFNSNVYHLLNLGGSPNPDLSCQTEDFFPGPDGTPGMFSQYLVSAFADLDGDGDDDALVGSGTDSEAALIRFRNDGSPTVPLMRFADDTYLRELDAGDYSAPAIGDLDGDDDPDLLLGTGSPQTTARFENVGDASDPAFAEVDPDWLPTPGSSWSAPEFADLDGDGDADVFLGTSRGDVRWFRNDGDGTSFPEYVDDTFGVNKLIRQRAESYAVPRFFDGDGDDDLDLLVGYWDFQSDATLLYYRNDGRATAPIFVFADGDYQGLGTLGQNLAPAVGDLDGDGDPDLLVGSFDGTLQFFRNIGTAHSPAFRPEPGFLDIDVGAASVPFLADLDGNGRLDLVVGESGGGMNHFRDTSTASNPSAFALASPAVDAEVNGRVSTLFDWQPSIDPVTSAEVGTYELRLALSPDAAPDEWWVIGGLATSQAHLLVQTGEFRFSRDFYWTVAAGEPCRGAPVPEWRHAINTQWLTQPPGKPDSTRHWPHGSDPSEGESAVTGSGDPGPVPLVFGITRVFPTPSRGAVDVELTLPGFGRVRVIVYDTGGRQVASLEDADLAAGRHVVTWSGLTSAGAPAAPGVYFVRAERADGMAATRRIVRLR